MKDAPSVKRIMFEQYVTPTTMGHCESPVLSFSRNVPSPMNLTDGEPAKTRSLVPIYPHVEDRLRSALLELDMPPYCMEHEKGPYADKAGTVERLTRAVIGDAGDNKELILERAIDLLRPFGGLEAECAAPRTFHDKDYNFMLLDGYAAIPDLLPCPGEILTQKERRTVNTDTGAPSIILTSMMEPYVLAASVLRRAGISAYPSLAVLPVEGTGMEMYTPVMSIVDITGDVPLQTFALMRVHPDFSSLILLSDAAVMGVLNAIVAETRANQLCVDMVEYSKAGAELPGSAIENQLKRIANALFEAHKLWPGTYFIEDANAVLSNEIAKATAVIGLSEKKGVKCLGGLADTLIAMVGSSQTFSEAIQKIQVTVSEPKIIKKFLAPILSIAQDTGGAYGNAVLQYLSSCIETDRSWDTFEGNPEQPGQ